MDLLENKIIESLKKGNEKSFELIFKTYYSRLCTYAFNYTKQLEVAEDIVKDTFLNIWNKKEKLNIKSTLSGYLFRSVHNSCINYLKREKRKNTTLSFDDLSNIDLKLKQPISTDYPLANILVKEMEAQIYEQIEKLPKQCREIFVLSRFEDLPHKKIAEKLNISENTVKVQIYRALIKLRKSIQSKSIILFNFFK